HHLQATHPNEPARASSPSSPPANAAGPQRVPHLVPAHPSAGGGKAPAPSKMKKPHADKDSDEYRQRRERNNLAVKKSRMRSKQKAQDTQQRVNELKEENERLEAKIKLLSKELTRTHQQPKSSTSCGLDPTDGGAAGRRDVGRTL
uniref:BZIP domain-containing protein n=1 Tax=Scophthalmus maximus TaxID=52904 RepID=A0A8D2ZMK7_SCOMX